MFLLIQHLNKVGKVYSNEEHTFQKQYLLFCTPYWCSFIADIKPLLQSQSHHRCHN